MTRPPTWNEAENRALCALYFWMLDNAVNGRFYNKAAMIRTARGEQTPSQPGGAFTPLGKRSRGSIELKLMNASAAHRDCFLGSDGDHDEPETMDGHGYRALFNYQAALKDAMRTALGERGHQQWAHRAKAIK